MRKDWYWRGFGFRFYQPRGWYVVTTPLGSAGVDHHRAVTEPWFSRGRCRQFELRIPLSKQWQMHLSTRGKDYLTLVNGPKELRNINWIIDEFDHNFNNLAIASLRYHLDWSVCDNEDRRGVYEDLITRLSEHETPQSRTLTKRYWRRENAWRERIQQARRDFVDIIPDLWS